MNRGIVMQVARRHCVVMTPDGAFHRVPSPDGCRVGEEIAFTIPARRLRVRRSLWMTAASALLIVALAMPRLWPGGTAHAEVAAYISMDINPSLEMGIARDERVLELSAFNPEGEDVIRGLDYEGKPAEEVAAELIDRVEAEGYLAAADAEVVIASVLVDDDASAAFEESAALHIDRAVHAALENDAVRREQPVKVTVLSAPKELLKESRELKVSPGKLAVYLLAKEEGADIALERIANEPIGEAAGQSGSAAEVAGDEGERQASKEKLKRLVKEELKKRKDDRLSDGKDKQSDPGHAGKPDGTAAGGGAKPADAPPGGKGGKKEEAKPDGGGGKPNGSGKGEDNGQAGKNGEDGGKGQAGKNGEDGGKGQAGKIGEDGGKVQAGKIGKAGDNDNARGTGKGGGDGGGKKAAPAGAEPKPGKPASGEKGKNGGRNGHEDAKPQPEGKTSGGGSGGDSGEADEHRNGGESGEPGGQGTGTSGSGDRRSDVGGPGAGKSDKDGKGGGTGESVKAKDGKSRDNGDAPQREKAGNGREDKNGDGRK